MRGSGLFCACVALTSCSLFWDTSEFSRGEETENDGGGSSTPDASIADTSSPSIDATDGAADAASDGEASALGFCASLNPKPKFCDDFDDATTTIAARWDRIFVSPTGIGVVELSDVALAGKAMSVRMNGAPDCSYTRAEKEFATNGKDLQLSFSMRPTGPWSTDAKSYAMVRFKTGGTIQCQIFLQLDGTGGVASGGLVLIQYGPSQTSEVFYTSAWPDVNVWSKIVMTTRANGSVVHTVNGTVADDRAFPAGCTFADSVTVGLGYHCEDESPEIRYDDVVVDYP